MKLGRRHVLLLALTATFETTCQRRRGGRSVKLRSGHVVQVLGSGRMYFAGSKQWALTVRYETSVPLSDAPALRSEAQDVVAVAAADADTAGLPLIALTACEPSNGVLVTTSRGQNFVAEKSSSGVWTLK